MHELVLKIRKMISYVEIYQSAYVHIYIHIWSFFNEKPRELRNILDAEHNFDQRINWENI